MTREAATYGDGGRPVLLVLDYPGRRQEARVADLRLERYGFDVRYLLTAPFPRAVTAGEYAAELARRHGPFTGEVAAVLSYCMASSVAQELAVMVRGGAGPVSMVLFDGEPVTPEAVDDQYRVARRQLAEQLGIRSDGDGEVRPFDSASLSRRPYDVIDWMRGSLVELGSTALGDDGSHEDDDEARAIAEDLADFYLDWLVHLVAAHNASWPVWDGDVLHVMSRTHAFSQDWPGARSTERARVDSPRPELLATAEAGAVAVAFLERSIRRGR